MDKKYMSKATITTLAIILIILALLLPCLISKNMEQQREIELEKYKIEMQYKHGDVVEEKEEVK